MLISFLSVSIEHWLWSNLLYAWVNYIYKYLQNSEKRLYLLKAAESNPLLTLLIKNYLHYVFVVFWLYYQEMGNKINLYYQYMEKNTFLIYKPWNITRHNAMTFGHFIHMSNKPFLTQQIQTHTVFII